jgi:hypothetical protein
MTPAIATYYPIAIVLAIAAAVSIALYFVVIRRWSGAVFVGEATTTSSAAVAIVKEQVLHRSPRLVAISGSVVSPTGAMRLISRQSLANRVRALEGVVSAGASEAVGMGSSPVLRRPGLTKGSARSDRRLAVVR